MPNFCVKIIIVLMQNTFNNENKNFVVLLSRSVNINDKTNNTGNGVKLVWLAV